MKQFTRTRSKRSGSLEWVVVLSDADFLAVLVVAASYEVPTFILHDATSSLPR